MSAPKFGDVLRVCNMQSDLENAQVFVQVGGKLYEYGALKMLFHGPDATKASSVIFVADPEPVTGVAL